MAYIKVETNNKNAIDKKARVYFTCHPVDFEIYFKKICNDIFKTHDCAIYYTADMTESINDDEKEIELGRNNLFVVPVTLKLLTTPNRAMDEDIPYAIKEHIPVLPIVMESEIDEIYSQPNKFGELQYLKPFSADTTEISYEDKLKKYLESVLISDELAERIRNAFDAYIFLSYRKKDRKYANELMRLIHSNPECLDIAIWFDEFLTPGESFKKNIAKILDNCKLFTLLVTPRLFEKVVDKSGKERDNYVISTELPLAKQKKKEKGTEIVAVEMEKTDKKALSEIDIEGCINSNDQESRNRLIEVFSRIATTENNTPEHNFLIGLAYLEGINVEVNRERGIDLIIKAAESELPEAIKKLYELQYSAYEFRHITLYKKISSVTTKMSQIDPSYYVRAEILRAEQSFSENKKYSEAIEILNRINEEYKDILQNDIEAYINFELNQIYILNDYYQEREKALDRINALIKRITLQEYPGDKKEYYKVFSKLYYHKGLIEYRLEQYDSCIESCKKAFDLSELGYSNPERLKCLILIVTGSYYLKTKNFENAISDFNESLKIRLKLYGENNLNIANSYNNLVKAYYKKAVYSKSEIEKIATEILDKWKNLIEKIIGKDSANIISCYYWEAKILIYQNNLNDAYKCAQKALEINTKFNSLSSKESEEMQNILNAIL